MPRTSILKAKRNKEENLFNIRLYYYGIAKRKSGGEKRWTGEVQFHSMSWRVVVVSKKERKRKNFGYVGRRIVIKFKRRKVDFICIVIKDPRRERERRIIKEAHYCYKTRLMSDVEQFNTV